MKRHLCNQLIRIIITRLIITIINKTTSIYQTFPMLNKKILKFKALMIQILISLVDHSLSPQEAEQKKSLKSLLHRKLKVSKESLCFNLQICKDSMILQAYLKDMKIIVRIGSQRIKISIFKQELLGHIRQGTGISIHNKRRIVSLIIYKGMIIRSSSKTSK